MSGLEIEGLVKRLGTNLVVDDVSFVVPDGKFFVLLGPSGGGKTTILRLICGLEKPDAGHIVIDGRDLTEVPIRDRNLAMVFQEYGLYPNMDVYQNIAYGLETRGVAKAEIRQRVQDAAQTLGLGELIRRPITDLSGGEQQRVALARAMAKDASAYLFDEPLSNLDPKLRSHARRQIMKLHRQKRRASLYVTHDQGEALAMGDRIGVMAKGRLQQEGTADELLHEPANLFVAGFIGSPPMNLIRAEVTRETNMLQVVSDGVTVTLPDRWNATIDRYGKSEIVLGIRPDGLSLNGAVHGRSVISGEVGNVEPLIGEMVVTMRLGSGTSISAVFEDSGGDSVSPGDVLQAGIDVDRICLFDPDSERALATLA